MKQEKGKYEQWLEKVKSEPPVLTDPEALTRDILQRVERMPQARKGKVYWMSWCPVAVAGALLCFMVYEVFFYSMPQVPGEAAFFDLPSAGHRLPEASSIAFSRMNQKEKRDYFFGEWKERKEKWHKQNAGIGRLLKIVNEKQLKTD